MKRLTYEEKLQALKDHGYKSLRAFSREINENVANTRASMINQRNVSMKVLVRYANALGGDIILAMTIFAESEIDNLINGFND